MKNLMPRIELLHDRRRTRYSGLRKAVERGLEPADVLKVKRNVQTEAVDPALGDKLVARLSRRLHLVDVSTGTKFCVSVFE